MRAVCRMFIEPSAKLADAARSHHAAAIVMVATLALCACCPRVAARDVGPLTQPLTVRFQLADGVRVAGRMTACDDDGFDGEFGRRLWTELNVDDAWRLHQRVMDASAASDWVNLGRVMLLMAPQQSKAAGLGERAFRRALQLDAAAQDAIDLARAEAAEIERHARDARRAAEAQKLSTISPEAGPWPADPWPALAEAEQAAAVNAMRAEAERILTQAALGMPPVESNNFLIYSDLPRAEIAEWATRLERVVAALEQTLNPGIDPLAKDKPHAIRPWGKVVVFIWTEHDRYRLVEADAFRQLVPLASAGMCHLSGPRAFVNMHRVDDDEAFEYALITRTVHALLHHYRSPARPPAWANEGFAEHIAAKANKYSHVRRDRRQAALEFIRAGQSVPALLDLRYESGWPAPEDPRPTVGGLLIELMINQKPQHFVRWLHAIKSGKHWQTALREDYGVSREELTAIATQFWTVNN